MSPTNDDRDRFLSAALAGDDDALGELIEAFRPMLRAEAMQTLAEVQGRVDASDVVQLTWWSAFRAFPKFEGDVDAFIGWLRNIHDRNLRDAVRNQVDLLRGDSIDIAQQGGPVLAHHDETGRDAGDLVHHRAWRWCRLTEDRV